MQITSILTNMKKRLRQIQHQETVDRFKGCFFLFCAVYPNTASDLNRLFLL